MTSGSGARRVIRSGQSAEHTIVHGFDTDSPRRGQPDGRMKRATRSKANSAKRGRKPTWRDGNLEQAKKLAALGATDVEMADFFGVSLRTFMRWKVSKPEFWHSLKVAKDAADERVERRLWERAVGYSVETEKIVCSGGRVIRVKTVEHYPPDTTACIFWLKNRQPEKWRDKVDQAQA